MNFQNIPRQEKVVKQAFVPKLDALMYFDYKQIEPRLFAYYLNSIGFPRFAEYIQSGIDPYTAVAIGYFGKDDIEDKERQLAKQTLLSLMYGGAEPAIMRYFSDLDWKGARQVKDQFYNTWPEILALQAKLESQIKSRTTETEPGYIMTLFGRHLHPDPMLKDDKQPYRKMLNALIQGCAADLMRYSLVVVDEWMELMRLESHMISTVHDEIQVDVVEAEADILAEWVPKLMAYPLVDKVVPILSDVEISRTNWAEKAPYMKELDVRI